MEDWQKDLGDFNKGLADSHESRQPWNKLNQNMQMGRRAGGHDNAESAPPAKGGVWSGNGSSSRVAVIWAAADSA